MTRSSENRITIEAHFEDIRWKISRELRAAKTSVSVCVAWISGKLYAPIFKELSDRGIRIEVIHNHDHINGKHGLEDLDIGNTSLHPIRSRHATAYMHNKFCIIDSETLISGSYNWSEKAKYSFENILIIKNDYHLIKKHYVEIEDLKNYARAMTAGATIDRCSHIHTDTNIRCKSNSYNIAIFGDEDKVHYESTVAVWNICTAHKHATEICSSTEIFVQNSIEDYDEETDWIDQNTPYDKDQMQYDLEKILDRRIRLQRYFHKRLGLKVHAAAYIAMTNPNQTIKYNEHPEYAIYIYWSDMYYRKLIPDLIEDGEGGTDEILRSFE